MQDTKNRQKVPPSEHHPTTLSGYIFATKACIDNQKKNLLNSNTSSTCPPQYGELRPTTGWDRFVSLGHPWKFQRVWRLGSVSARHSSSGRQPNFAALNRGRHLYSAGRPSRWALAHILVIIIITVYRVHLYTRECTCTHVSQSVVYQAPLECIVTIIEMVFIYSGKYHHRVGSSTVIRLSRVRIRARFSFIGVLLIYMPLWRPLTLLVSIDSGQSPYFYKANILWSKGILTAW